jgi:hypothetical protein
MKVLINALSARRGGIVTYTRNVSAALVERGIDVVVAAPSGLGIESVHGRHIKIDVAEYRPLRRAVWEQVIWRRIVARVRPGYGSQHQRRVLHRACYRPDRVHRPAGGQRPGPAHPPERRPQSHDAAVGGGYANRAARIAPQCRAT